MADALNVYQRLLAVQKTAHAPREVDGRFGKARSAEQILEAYKPICNDNGLYLYTNDEMQDIGGRNYVTATATVVNVEKPDESHSASASAWENEVSGGLDTSQVTGKTSSYAKKYALQNLFAIDDTKDADQDPKAKADPAPLVAKSSGTAVGASELDRAKVSIFKQLNDQGYDTELKQKTFIAKVLQHSTIDNINEAILVADALDAEKEIQ